MALHSSTNRNQEKSEVALPEAKVSEDVTTTSSSTASSSPMDEFFEPKENWEKTEVPTGRSWRKDDLRLKSNSDLHKLW